VISKISKAVFSLFTMGVFLMTIETVMNLIVATTPTQDCNWQRRKSLLEHGLTELEILELLAYNKRNFGDYLRGNDRLESSMVAWQKYLADAAKIGVWETLRRNLVQLRFKVATGMSENPEYLASTRRGLMVPARTISLEMRSPWRLQLLIHQTKAVAIPIIFTPERVDFESLVQAMFFCNEPIKIPLEKRACIVSGLNNWDRVRAYRTQWESQRGNGLWLKHWQRLQPKKSLFQDRFIILTNSN
jgi:hypothetical protein